MSLPLPRYTGTAVLTPTNAPAFGATVTVYNAGTLVPASLFMDSGGVTPLGNPLTADASTGIFSFCVANGLYDITVTGTGVPSYTIPSVQLVYQGAPIAQLLLSVTDVSHAQILTLPTTPVTLVAAPGSGLVTEPWGGRLYGHCAGGAYTNIDPAAFLQVTHAGLDDLLSYLPNDVAMTNGSTTRLTDFLSAVNSRAILLPYNDTEGVADWGPVPKLVNATYTDIENQPITLSVENGALGAFTGGDPTNSLRVVLLYTVQAAP